VFRRLTEEVVHQGHIWRVVVAEFEAPDRSTFRRDIVRSPGAVGVVPVVFDAEGNPMVVLVEQYRPAFDRDVLEIPAGMRDVVGEPPATTAHRELAEEAGLVAGELHHLVDLAPSPGMTDSITSVYLATGCTPTAQDLQGPEEEHLRVLEIPLVEALEMIDRGEIVDSKTVVGLLALDRRLRRTDAGG
jgi:ADP-ribose pyrophosphatase